MKRVLIGHRGVGKSSLLVRHKEYFPGVPHFDLDQEIENQTQRKIYDIFTQEGESYFRNLELETFKRLISLNHFVISLGGGFSPQNIPKDIETIFVSRRTDSDGRLFLGRPKINQQLSDLEDSLALYHRRHQHFLDRADFIYHMPEGINRFDELEKQILQSSTSSVKAYRTVLKNTSEELLHHALELRTDILTANEIQFIVKQYPQKSFLISYRRSGDQILNIPLATNILFDWALELGSPLSDFMRPANVLSIHDLSIEAAITQFKKFPQIQLKLCPEIDSWDELILGYRWQQENPMARSFLPRTREGKSKFRWFRILATQFQKINFVQSFIEMDDQPSFYDLMSLKYPTWGAVLGNPIHHSFSPIEQRIIAVPLDEKDFAQALPFLTELGMRYAAVTSPLKTVAGNINSLAYKNGQWIKASTDQYGFKKLLEQIPAGLSHQVAVWGGEGVLPALKKVLPDLQCYSARTGTLKNTGPERTPEILIWAAPRFSGVKFPNWAPQIVLDLNYTADSMGLECAKKFNCEYVSGLSMFLEQAKYQREFWKENL